MDSAVDSAVVQAIRSVLSRSWYSLTGGRWSCWWFAYCGFYRDVCGLDLGSDLWQRHTAYEGAMMQAGWAWLHRDFVVVSDNVRFVQTSSNRLHRDGGPAIEFRDGWALWYLNGVRVPRWLAETKAEDLEPRRLAEIPNAEVRREFVRKVGADRICHAIGTVVHESGGYALMDLEVVPGAPRKYLRMNNPSVPGVMHFEAVHPSCRTVEHAINWRRYGMTDKNWKPSVLT